MATLRFLKMRRIAYWQRHPLGHLLSQVFWGRGEHSVPSAKLRHSKLDPAIRRLQPSGAAGPDSRLQKDGTAPAVN